MAPSASLVRDSPAARWLRRSAPFWILLGIALLAAMPGVLTGPDDLDSQTRPVGHLAVPDGADARARPTADTRSGS